MKVKVRKFGGEDARVSEVFDNICTVQTGREGTIVWVSEETFGADILVTINPSDHIVRKVDEEGDRGTLWVVGEGND